MTGPFTEDANPERVASRKPKTVATPSELRFLDRLTSSEQDLKERAATHSPSVAAPSSREMEFTPSGQSESDSPKELCQSVPSLILPKRLMGFLFSLRSGFLRGEKKRPVTYMMRGKMHTLNPERYLRHVLERCQTPQVLFSRTFESRVREDCINLAPRVPPFPLSIANDK